MNRLLVVLVAALLVAACAKEDNASPTSAPAAPAQTEEAARGETVSYTKEDSGEQADVAVGDTVRITLDENPSTGYGWKITKKPASSVLEKTRDAFVGQAVNPSGPPMVGQGGEHVWEFKAVGVGTTEIQLDLFPPGSTKSEKTYSNTVRVS